MNLAVLKTEARNVAKRQQDRLQKAIDENRDLTAEEEAADDADKKELASLTAKIHRSEAAVAAAGVIGNDPVTITGNTGAGTLPAAARPTLDNGGFANVAEFAQAVRFANPAAGNAFRMDDRLAAPTNVHMETGDAAGSFLVPAEFRQQIVDLVFANDDPFMDMISPDPTSSNRVQGLGDESTPWGTSGIVARWRAEAEQMQPSRLALTPRETKLNELYCFVLATEELLEDAPRVATLLTTKAAGAIRWVASDAFMYGDGVEKPLGYMESGALITIAKEAGQTADTVVRANIAKMFSRMINPGQASWIINSDALPSLIDVKSDQGVPLWQANFVEAPGGTLLGRPVIFSEHARSIGDKGDIQFVNPNGYEAFRKQNGVSFADSIHLYFDYNIRAFRWIFRVGGQPVLSAPVSPANGTTTKSHFVALAERA
jgi:HK97 family phage major capsid protein